MKCFYCNEEKKDIQSVWDTNGNKSYSCSDCYDERSDLT